MKKNDAKIAPSSKKNEQIDATKAPVLKKNELTDAAKASMKTRIISSIVMVLILIPTILIGNWVYFGVMTVLLGFACYEILGCAHKRNVPIFIIFFIFVVLMAYWPMFKELLKSPINARVDNYFTSISIPLLLIVAEIFIFFLLTVIFKDFTVKDACFLTTMGTLIGLGFQCLLFLRFVPTSKIYTEEVFPVWDFTFESTVKPSLLLIFVLISTFATDIGAYFVGVLFGKNKMNERISPKKTWEGFVGGVIISFLISTSVALTLSACGYPLAPGLTVEKWYFIMILCLFLPLFATLGDFVFSSIKRSFDVKDYGKLIPGHGGVLDRLDSIIFASIFTAMFIFIFLNSGGWEWLI